METAQKHTSEALTRSLTRLCEEAARAGVERFVAAAIVADEDNKVLVLKRAAGEAFLPGLEELPSGGVETGETLDMALRREVREETGLTIAEVFGLVDSFDYRSKSGKLTRQWNFHVRTLRDTVRLDPAEHVSYRWLKRAELEQVAVSDLVRLSLQRFWSA